MIIKLYVLRRTKASDGGFNFNSSSLLIAVQLDLSELRPINYRVENDYNDIVFELHIIHCFLFVSFWLLPLLFGKSKLNTNTNTNTM